MHRMTNPQVLHARKLAAEGVTLVAIGRELGFSTRTIQYWVSQPHRLPFGDTKLAEPPDGKARKPYHQQSCTKEKCEHWDFCQQILRERWIERGLIADYPCFAQLKRERDGEPPRRGMQTRW